MAGLILFVGISALFDEKTQPVIIRSLSAFFVLALVIPAWKFAVSRVSAPPANNGKKTEDLVESLMKDVQALSPSERESLPNHLEAIADMKESSELHTKIIEQWMSAQSGFKHWLTLESVQDTFTTLG